MESAELERTFHVLAFFKYEHLPVVLQELSKPIGDFAFDMAQCLNHKADPAVVQHLSERLDGLASTIGVLLETSQHPEERALGLEKLHQARESMPNVSKSLRLLLEAKDCLVRARLPATGQPIPKP